ncbi:Uncharacterized protein FWK35_00020545 [Aphis craccivora]|uniref:Uncharacterized protein n=1 Tax=Aphis craccivora TaxID=307492 RepID=A0A6G0YDJ6_APHCR|nr:Uncharacterized protein FWK35_00020545 [Aphis craccivora]
MYAACSNNEVILYRASRREALRRLFASPGDGSGALTSIVQARWCVEYPGIVFGLDSLSSIHMWDLCDNITTPKISIPFQGKTVTAISLTSTPTNRNTFMIVKRGGVGFNTMSYYVGLAFVDGKVELHQLKLDKRNETADRCEQLTSFLAGL